MLYNPHIPPIAEFRGRYRFLSNFYPAIVNLDSIPYPTVEHAFQAAKTIDVQHRERIRKCNKPGDAKRLGRRVPLRSDWEQVKLYVMLNLLRQKFSQTEFLKTQLLATGEAQLIEGNTWNDFFWGECMGTGENHLGKLLMRVRQELRR